MPTPNGLLIYAAHVQRRLEKDYGLRGLFDQSVAAYCEDFIHDAFVGDDGETTMDILQCAQDLAHQITSGVARKYKRLED